MESALFYRFQKNWRPVLRFWELWRSKMRFGQNVLRMTWKKRFVQFSWKAHCFPVLKRISAQFCDFENFDGQKCDLAKTCCAWPEKSVLYNFHGKRTVFPSWREFQPSFAILRTLTVKNAIWPKRAAHDLKKAFCTIFMESALFSRLEENFSPVLRFWELWRWKMRFGQNVLRMTWKERFVEFFYENCSKTVLFMEGALFFRFEENFSPVLRFWELWRWKMRFGQNVLRMTWKERFVEFFYENCSKTVLFMEGALFFRFEENFWASFTILRTLTLTNAIWPKRVPHDLKRALCTSFMKSALFSLFGENFKPVWRFWELWRSQMRFGRNVLRMT